MAVTDFWGNTLDTNTGTAIGYRGTFEEFPHQLYSFILSTVRDADQKETALIYRWMTPLQQHWESQYASILSLPNLYSPELCPEVLLEYLRKNIGITDDLSYLWGVMNETERRRLIKYFIRFCQYRFSSYGVNEIIEAMTGVEVFIYGFFHYRWLLSGDFDSETEGSIGREEAESDMWLISEEDMPVGIIPTDVSVLTDPTSGSDYYVLQVDSLIESVTEYPVPQNCIVRCLLTGESIVAPIYEDGGNYFIQLAINYFFEQSETDPSEEVGDFRVSFEPDPFVFDIFIVDDGTLNRNMVRGLARFSRPASERIYIRYHKLIETYQENVIERWSTITGTVVINEDDRYVVIGDSTTPPGTLSIHELIYTGADEWQDYSIVIKAEADTNEKYIEFRFMYQNTNNYYYFRATPKTPPAYRGGEWELGVNVSGTPSVLDSGTMEWFDINVNYVWRIISHVETRSGGDVQHIWVYQDENEIVEYVEDPISWSSAFGTIQLVAEDGTEMTVTVVRVRGYPGENDYVGP